MGQIRKFPNRPGWYVDWSDARGRRHRSRVHGGKRDAERLLRERDAQTRLERDRLALGLPAPGDGDESIEALVRDWRQALTDARRRPATWKSYWLGLKEVLGWLAARGRPAGCLSDLDLRDLQVFADEKHATGASARTVNLRVGAMAALCRWAVREGRAVVNPLVRWRPVRGPKVRERRALTEVETAKLLLGSPPHLADLWRFVLGTGLRAGELSALEWRDVDLGAGMLRVRSETSKSKRERSIPLRADLVTVLRRQQAGAAERAARAAARLERAKARSEISGSGFWSQRELRAARAAVEAVRKLVFTNSRGGPWRSELSRKLKPCLEEAGLDRTIDVHTLRHTFGSQLVALGTDVKTVQDLMGHSSALVTLDVYSHAFADRKREAVAALRLVPDERATETGADACAAGG